MTISAGSRSTRGLVLAIALSLTQLACFRQDVQEYEGPTMGTRYSVKTAGVAKSDRIRAGIERALDEVNAQMSTYLPASDLSRFNAYKGKDWFAVPKELREVAGHALVASRLTGGAFDATVFPLVDLWGFGPRRTQRVPSDSEITHARKKIGFRHLTVREEPPALKKAIPSLTVDLSAIAKGYSVDRVAEFLESEGVERYFVEVGGEARAKGVKTSGKPWLVGIEKPVEGRREILRVVPLTDTAMATSGDYRNFFERDGKHYSHVIDPRTGRPVDHDVVSVTILLPSCAMADAYATAFLVLGAKEGLLLAEKLKLAVMFVHRSEGKVPPRLSFSSTFPKSG